MSLFLISHKMAAFYLIKRDKILPFMYDDRIKVFFARKGLCEREKVAKPMQNMYRACERVGRT